MPPSLYANLLNKKANPGANASSPAVISSEPVKYSFKKSEDELKEEKKAADAALRFQPVKRPQVQQQKAKPRGIPASSSPDKQLPPTERKAPPAAPAPAAVGGDSIENWIDEDADDYYVAEYTRHKEEQKERQREDKKRRKKKNNQHETREVNWNSIYEPDQPIRLEDYRGSLEELDAKYEWKQRLHAHQRKKTKAETRAASEQEREVKPPAFAPPANYNFAPPPQQDSSSTLSAPTFNRVPPPSTFNDRRVDLDEDDDYEPPPAVANVPATNIAAATGDTSYVPANHGTHAQTYPPPTAAPPFIPPPPPAPAQHFPGLAYPPPPVQGMPPPPGQWQCPPGGIPPPLPGMGYPPPPPGMPFPPPPQFLAAQAAAHHSPSGTPAPLTFTPSAAPAPAPAQPAQPPSAAATISRAPVRYTQPAPDPPEDETPVGGLGFTGASASASEAPSPSDNDQDEDQPRSKAPGQKGFAKRLLQKYGWKEGQGLGADNSGITTILQHQTQKRKKKADAEGGGWAGAAAMGRIVGGKKRKIEGEEEDGSDGKWSIVARFEGMLSGMDIDHEIGEGDLMQRMGERMAEYGVVERLYIHRQGDASPVFVKFTSALSAYRAVQASQGKDFLGNGRIVKSGFWDEDKFANDVYE